MKITDVKVFPVDEDKLKAYATITFDNCFIVRDLKVISGNKGYFIAMPSKKRKDGTFRDVAHPLNSETRKMIEDAVLEVYEKENVPGSEPTPYTEDDAAQAGSEAVSPGAGYEGDVSEDPVPEDHVTEEHVPDEHVPDEHVPEDDAPVDTEDTTVADEPAAEIAEEVPESGESEPAEPEPSRESEKGAEENPVIEPSDDPEKAFGYKE
jgi:stage V sporulation protein G